MMHRSIALRFAITAFAGTALILAGLGVYLSRSVETHFAELDRAELTGALNHLAYMAQSGGTPDMATLLEQVRTMNMGHGALLVRIESRDGKILADTLGFSPPALRYDASRSTLVSATADGRNYRLLTAPFEAGRGRVLRAWVAMNIDHHQTFMSLFRNALWTAIGIALLLSLALSALAARWGLAPLDRLRMLLREVSGAHLAVRLDPADLPRELAGLAAEFNQMLARLDDAFRRLSQFSSDIAHELRTPVGNLMVETEVALGKARSIEEYQEVLYSNLEELRRLTAMIADMLFLARADNKLVTPNRERIDLQRTVADLCQWFEASAEEHRLHLIQAGTAGIEGDRMMVQRALSNLLANAIRHATPCSDIHIGIEHTGAAEVTLSVSNAGAAISPEHLPRLFDRFYQADPSRTRKGEGSGLGLAITRSIVEAHGGNVTVSSADGTTEFRMRFPTGATSG